jgi:hypothetical protein
MKIKIDSNFVLPGLERENEIYLDHSRVTLRKVLEELSLKSSGRVKYIHPSTGVVDHMNFLIEINGVPNQGSGSDLEKTLSDGDTVTIKLYPLGGG